MKFDDEKDRAYREFYEYVRERLVFFARRGGGLPQEAKEILEKKRAALVEKYGPEEFNPFDKTGCP